MRSVRAPERRSACAAVTGLVASIIAGMVNLAVIDRDCAARSGRSGAARYQPKPDTSHSLRGQQPARWSVHVVLCSRQRAGGNQHNRYLRPCRLGGRLYTGRRGQLASAIALVRDAKATRLESEARGVYRVNWKGNGATKYILPVTKLSRGRQNPISADSSHPRPATSGQKPLLPIRCCAAVPVVTSIAFEAASLQANAPS